MSTITIGMRLDSKLLEAVDVQAVRQRRSRNQILTMAVETWLESVQRLDDHFLGSEQTKAIFAPERVAATERAIEAIVGVSSASHMKSPKHAVSCKCFSCKPPK